MHDFLFQCLDLRIAALQPPDNDLMDGRILAKGVHADHLGPVVVTRPTFDEDGKIKSPAMIDPAHHFNLSGGIE